MFFKNLQIYRLPVNYALTAAELEEYLKPQQFQACSSSEMTSQGWVSPRNDGQLVYGKHRQMLIQLVTERKLLPPAVINEVVKARAGEFEDQHNYKPGRKQMREIKEKVTDELLPRAFSIKKATNVWIDATNGWLVIDTATASVADEVIHLLNKAIDRFPAKALKVKTSPVNAMTQWLLADEAPDSFSIDSETELRSSGETMAAVKYTNALLANQLQEHISAGKRCTRLAVT